MAYGVTLSLEGGRIAWESRRPPPDNLLVKLTEHRTEIIDALAGRSPLESLSTEDRWLIESWLDHIGETDDKTRRWVVEKCAADHSTLSWVLAEADGAGLAVQPIPDTSTQSPSAPASPAPLEALEGLPLLPDDKAFLLDLLSDKSLPAQQRLLDSYRDVWIGASTEEPTPHRKDNRGRRTANSWIRHGKDRSDWNR